MWWNAGVTRKQLRGNASAAGNLTSNTAGKRIISIQRAIAEERHLTWIPMKYSRFYTPMGCIRSQHGLPATALKRCISPNRYRLSGSSRNCARPDIPHKSEVQGSCFTCGPQRVQQARERHFRSCKDGTAAGGFCLLVQSMANRAGAQRLACGGHRCLVKHGYVG